MPTPIFRITHYKNLSHILKNGIHCSKGEIKNSKFQPIGNQSVILARDRWSVKIKPFGVLNDYVPFYFGTHLVMLLNIHTGRVPDVEINQEELIYIVSSVETVVNEDLDFIFTDGHALEIITEQYNDLSDLVNLDWDVINAKYWANDAQDNDCQRRKQSEFLVFQKFPISCILEIGVFSDKMKDAIDTVLLKNKCGYIPCVTKRSWYY